MSKTIPSWQEVYTGLPADVPVDTTPRARTLIASWEQAYSMSPAMSAQLDDARRQKFHAFLEEQAQPGYVPMGYESWIAEGQARLARLRERKQRT